MSVSSWNGTKYMFTMTDDFTRKIFVYSNWSKDDVVFKFREFQQVVDNHTAEIKKDWEMIMEFVNNSFSNYLKSQGIVQQMVIFTKIEVQIELTVRLWRKLDVRYNSLSAISGRRQKLQILRCTWKTDLHIKPHLIFWSGGKMDFRCRFFDPDKPRKWKQKSWDSAIGNSQRYRHPILDCGTFYYSWSQKIRTLSWKKLKKFWKSAMKEEYLSLIENKCGISLF